MFRCFFGSAETKGVKRALRVLKREYKLQRRHQRSLKRAATMRGQALKLNIGCGDNLRPGWINIDLSPKAQLQLDLREPLPFEDGSVATVYSEHFFEHLEYPEDAQGFLKESLRVLMPGGLFSVGVPDSEWPLRAYVNGEDEYFRMARERWHPDWCNTRLHHLNFHFRQEQEHKYAYDLETLSQVLGDAGFTSIAQRPFDPELDDPAKEIGTLYVDAHKPGG